MTNLAESSEPEALFNRWAGTKDSTYENVEVPEELGPIPIEATGGLVKQYAFCMDDYRSWHFSESPFGGPIGHAALLANDLLTVYYTNYDRTTVTGLHTEEELTFLRPVHVGEKVMITGRFVDKYIRRGNGHVVMEAEASDSEGNVLVKHRGIEIMRVHPGKVIGRSTAKPPAKRIVPETSDSPAVARAAPGLVAGTPIVPLTKWLSQEQISVYSFVGEHERNFHNDLELARKGGLDNTIAQGLQTAGYFSDLCTGFFGAQWFTTGWIKAKFLLPVFPGSDLTVSGKVAGHHEYANGGLRTNLELWAKDQDDRLVSVAWAAADSSQQP